MEQWRDQQHLNRDHNAFYITFTSSFYWISPFLFDLCIVVVTWNGEAYAVCLCIARSSKMHVEPEAIRKNRNKNKRTNEDGNPRNPKKKPKFFASFFVVFVSCTKNYFYILCRRNKHNWLWAKQPWCVCAAHSGYSAYIIRSTSIGMAWTIGDRSIFRKTFFILFNGRCGSLLACTLTHTHPDSVVAAAATAVVVANAKHSANYIILCFCNVQRRAHCFTWIRRVAHNEQTWIYVIYKYIRYMRMCAVTE